MFTMKKVFIFGILMLFLVSFVCADDGKKSIGQSCLYNSQCESGYCLFDPLEIETGVCAEKPKPIGSSCFKNTHCESNYCKFHDPLAETGVCACTTNDDCFQCVGFKLNQIACVNGECIDIYDYVPICNKEKCNAPCVIDDDCPQPDCVGCYAYCDTQTCTCIEMGPQCQSDDDCSEGKVCSNEVCVSVAGCIDNCGDGNCDEIVCQGPGCPCSETEETCPEDCNETQTDKICCRIYGLGNMMKKVNIRYQWVEESDCVTSKGFVGGGREIVDNKFCEIQNKIKKIIKAKNRLRIQAQEGECPENCICTGSVTRCRLTDGTREMTVTAGKSGNIIVQVKGINMSTNVTLYHHNGSVYGVFKNNQTKIVNVMPDEVKEKIRARIKAKLQDEEIELDEDGIYQVIANKKARLFYLFSVREKIRAQIDSETGEIIRIRNPWWGFLARDVKEEVEE